MLSLISQRHAFSLETFAATEQQRGKDSGLTCFSTLVAGSAYLDAPHQRLRFLPFRYDNVTKVKLDLAVF